MSFEEKKYFFVTHIRMELQNMFGKFNISQSNIFQNEK